MGQKKWKKIAFACVIIGILFFSFWYGGNADGLRGFSFSNETETNVEVAENSVDKEIENDKKSDENRSEVATTQEPNFFQQIVMNIKKKSSSSSNSRNTQNNKAAQKNANKATDKSSKSNEKKSKTKSNNTKQNDTSNTTSNNDSQNSNNNNENTDNNTTNTDTNNTNSNTNNSTTTEANSDTIKCTIYISCAVLLDNMDKLTAGKQKIVSKDGVILKATTVSVKKDSTVFDVLQKATKENKVSLEYSFTPLYKSYYIEGIGNLYEFDAGELSGWMYSVNDEFPGSGCSSYTVKDGDIIKWLYTCNLGKDVGGYIEE